VFSARLGFCPCPRRGRSAVDRVQSDRVLVEFVQGGFVLSHRIHQPIFHEGAQIFRESTPYFQPVAISSGHRACVPDSQIHKYRSGNVDPKGFGDSAQRSSAGMGVLRLRLLAVWELLCFVRVYPRDGAADGPRPTSALVRSNKRQVDCHWHIGFVLSRTAPPR